MSIKDHQRPRLPLTFFRWYCRQDLREEIEGDLLARFQKESIKHGVRKAKVLCAKEVLLLFRPAIIGNLSQVGLGYKSQ